MKKTILLLTCVMIIFLVGCKNDNKEDAQKANMYEDQTSQENEINDEDKKTKEEISINKDQLKDNKVKEKQVDTNNKENTTEKIDKKDSFLVVIDPGHQLYGNNQQEPIGPGAIETKNRVTSGTQGRYSGVSEYALNLEVSLKLRDELQSRGYKVIMTRESNDIDISNIERAQIANKAGADAFIRIHADGGQSGLEKGTMTMCQSPNNPYNGYLYNESRNLSQFIVDETCLLTGSNNRGVMETDNMSGINWSKVPVTIVEMGFMTNKEEDLLMQTDTYQQKIVLGIANGLDRYFYK